MSVINISLPSKLKTDGQKLVEEGHFVSFSDLMRTALRDLLAKNKYDQWAKEAKDEYKRGKSIVLESKEDINKYIDSLSEE
jgi:Arc/MetJ-type ribon-helix-helix transcriptional regulator